jgi:DNA repair protein RAD5
MGLGKTIQMLALIHSNIPEGIEVPKQSTALLPHEPKLHTVDYAPYTTLVIAPMSLLSQWESECDAASKPNTLKTMVYYASGREDLRKLCTGHSIMSAPNVIITSYGTVLSEFSHLASSGTDRVQHGGLFSIRFNRIILDEAHNIKNRNSKTAKACYELEATHRWVLTGTPIVNRLEDLFSLVRFLRVEPWGNFAFWRTFVTVPFEEQNFLKALDMVQTVLEPLVMRRTKDMKLPDGSPLVPLPSREIVIEHIDLSEQERLVYDHIYNRVAATVNANIEVRPFSISSCPKERKF